MKIKFKGILCLTIILSLILSLTTVCIADDPQSPQNEDIQVNTAQNKKNSYFSYYVKHGKTQRPSQELTLENPIYQSENHSITLENETVDFIDTSNTWIEYTVSVEKDSVYSLFLEYYQISESIIGDMKISVMLDSALPFNEAQNITIPRVFKDSTHGEFEKDKSGNDIRPKQIPTQEWTNRYLLESTGQYNEPFLFFLSAGTHKVKIKTESDGFAIRKICFKNPQKAPSYQTYKNEYKGLEDEGKSFVIEAEHAYRKTSSKLYPIYDRSGPATTPSHFSKIRLNTIGGANWSQPGSMITWKFNVEQSGYYKLAFRARQNFSEGLNSCRAVYIDGEIPFDAAANIEFPYSLKWDMKVLGGEKPAYVYLEAGEHTLSMENIPGKVAPALRQLQQVTSELNEIYRKIIMVTSVSPDVYRDYRLDSEIPDLIENLTYCKKQLSGISKYILKITGSNGTKASLIDQAVVILEDMLKSPSSIPERLSDFKSSMEGIGSLLLALGEQPLEIDRIEFINTKDHVSSTNSGFFQSLSFSAKAFVASFIGNYNAVGELSNTKDSIDVWVSTGRDQAQIIRTMIDEEYTGKTSVNVNLNIVDTGTTLIQATLAGKGPHVALSMPKETPVNLAMRRGLVDLSKYDIDSIYDDFYESAWTPYRYQNGIFAIPETQVFDMLFYRIDILNELNIKIPDTWDSLYQAIEKIQSANLTVGIQEMDRNNLAASVAISTFDKFLFQQSSTYYNDNLSETLFTGTAALKAFEQTTSLYTEYGLPREFDFYNRFRSGEMPIAIQSYSMYNLLSQAAPEIRGLWSFCPIPGTPKEDGSVDKSESSSSTGCIMLTKAVKDGKDKIAFDFIKWWTSAEIQGQFGNELEAAMGSAARYTPANKKAFDMIAWTGAEKASITEQWKFVKDVPQIPGNYYIVRSLTSAIRLTIDSNGNPRRELLRYNKDINSEIKRKRKEFNLK